MSSVGAKYNKAWRETNGANSSSSTSNAPQLLGLVGSGELYTHICKLVSVISDPRVKTLVTRYNGWYLAGGMPPKFILEIKDSINSELWASPIEYSDNTTIEAFCVTMLSHINMVYTNKAKLMTQVNKTWVINATSTNPYMNLSLFNKYVRGFILWNMVDPILLNPNIDTQPNVNASSNSNSKSAYDTLFPDDSDCSSNTNTTSEKRGPVEDLIYNLTYGAFNSARVNLKAAWDGANDGMNGKKR
jgi:hypothetical protein